MMPEGDDMFGWGINRMPITVDGVEYAAFGHDGWSPPHTAALAHHPDCKVTFFAADSSSGRNGAARRGNSHGEIFALIESTFALGTGQQTQPVAYLLFERFSDRMNDGFDAALAGLEADLDTLDPIDAPERDPYALGSSFQLRGDSVNALRIFELGTRRFPDHGALQFGFGQSLVEEGRSAEAAAALRRAQALFPAESSAQTQIAQALEQAEAGR